MNMFKKNGGFTLVELIVVIAILAILAGVAVPAYTGYIKKAQDAAVLSELGAVLTAAQAVTATDEDGLKNITITTGEGGGLVVNKDVKDADGKSLEIKSLAPFYEDDDVTKLLEKMADTTTYAAGATWTPDKGWK